MTVKSHGCGRPWKPLAATGPQMTLLPCTWTLAVNVTKFQLTQREAVFAGPLDAVKVDDL